MALRRIQLELRSIARCETRSTLRPTIAVSSSSIATWSSRLQSACGANLTSRSRSLSGRKSSRSADPNTRSSAIFHRRQNLASCSVGMGISVRMPLSPHQFATTGPSPPRASCYGFLDPVADEGRQHWRAQRRDCGRSDCATGPPVSLADRGGKARSPPTRSPASSRNGGKPNWRSPASTGGWRSSGEC